MIPQSLAGRLNAVWKPIPRRAAYSARLVWLMLASRFLDEWWGGLLIVLLPTIRTDLGLTYAQVSILLASFGWAGWVADPVTGLVSDVWPRRPIIAGSAAGTALVLLALSGVGSFPLLLAVCVGYSIGVTPLAIIADAVLVDGHPQAAGRIMARQTLIDTLGALLAPLTASLLALLGVDWPLAFALGGAIFAGYGLLLWRTRFPPAATPAVAPADDASPDPGGWRMMWRNLRTISRRPLIWRWLFFITMSDFMTDVALGFMPLFLADVLGLGTGAIGLVMAVYMAAGTVTLAFLEPLLARFGEERLLTASVIGCGLSFALWVLNPVPELVPALLVAYAASTAALWPLGKARLLSAADGLTATVKALGPLAGLPTNVIPLLVGGLAGIAGLRVGLLLLLIAPPIMLWLLWTGRSARHADHARRPAADGTPASG